MHIYAYCDGGYNTRLKCYFGSYKIFLYNDIKLVEEVNDLFHFSKVNTSPESEYNILLKLLRTLFLEYSKDLEINIFSDCLLVVNQVNQEWNIEAKNLKPYYTEIIELKNKFKNLKISWISNKHIKRILGH
jgi:ribonuclease HI